MTQRLPHLGLTSLICLLTACGGGGGDSSTPAPVSSATNDSFVVGQDTATLLAVLNNDTAVTASSLALASEPGHGSVSLNGSTFSYTPAAGYLGTDAFSYSVTGNDGRTLTANVAITVNSVPVAMADSFSVIVNTPQVLDILANDTDSDGSLTGGITVTTSPQGTLKINSGNVTYTPPDDYTGSDSFSYQVADNLGTPSNIVKVTINVDPITTTTLSVTPLPIPKTDYHALNNAELRETVLTSPTQDMIVPPNTVSYTLVLRGNAVNLSQNGLFISNLADPAGNVPVALFRNVIACDTPLCTADMPKRPDQVVPRGDWSFRLGTTDTNLDNISFADMHLELATRVGPKPDLTAAYPATFYVHPYLTATSVDHNLFQLMLDQLVQIAASNQVKLVLSPTTYITDPQYSEVSSDFTDPTTAALVQMGDAAKVNIFFLESFTGTDGGGTIGISPGIPGTPGIQSNLNGVLINATATAGSAPDYYARTTAEIAFHEMGHLLGLFHTTEMDFSDHDILDDTPECTKAMDADSNGQADPNECPDGLNMMFWTNDFDSTKQLLTDDQKFVLFYSVLASP